MNPFKLNFIKRRGDCIFHLPICLDLIRPKLKYEGFVIRIPVDYASLKVHQCSRDMCLRFAGALRETRYSQLVYLLHVPQN
jgi:hypothetical protein